VAENFTGFLSINPVMTAAKIRVLKLFENRKIGESLISL
jgi:hypothetical protein